LLELSGVANPQITLDGTTTTGQRGLIFAYNGTGYGQIGQNVSTGELRIRSGESGQSGYFINFSVNGSDAARIDSSGRLLVGTSSTNGSFNSAIQIAGSGVAGTQLISRFDNNAGAPNLYFAKSRGASVGTNTLVQSGDEVGNIGFYAADGTNYVPAAQIRADIDGTPGTNDMPGRLRYSYLRYRRFWRRSSNS
jgi:hypothetical protein